MRVTGVLPVPPQWAIGIAALTLVAVAAACGDAGAPSGSPTTSSTPAITPPVITGRITLTPVDPGMPFQTLARLLRFYPNVVVGQVDGVLQPFDPRPGYLGVSPAVIAAIESAPPGKGGPITSEMLARPPGSWTSIYSVRVLESVV